MPWAMGAHGVIALGDGFCRQSVPLRAQKQGQLLFGQQGGVVNIDAALGKGHGRGGKAVPL